MAIPIEAIASTFKHSNRISLLLSMDEMPGDSLSPADLFTAQQLACSRRFRTVRRPCPS